MNVSNSDARMQSTTHQFRRQLLIQGPLQTLSTTLLRNGAFGATSDEKSNSVCRVTVPFTSS